MFVLQLQRVCLGWRIPRGRGQKVPGETRVDVPPKCWPLPEGRSSHTGQEAQEKAHGEPSCPGCAGLRHQTPHRERL